MRFCGRYTKKKIIRCCKKSYNKIIKMSAEAFFCQVHPIKAAQHKIINIFFLDLKVNNS